MGLPQPDTGSVTEDSGVVGGFLTTTGDADFGPYINNDAGQWTAETITGLYGSTLVINSDGEWTYTADNSNASIQALDTGETLTEVFTISSTQGTTTVTITINGVDEPPCFVSGTLIATPQGDRPVESLRPGDEVITRDNGVQPLRWAGARRVRFSGPADAAFQPIRIRKGALGHGIPERDILLSPMHRVLLAGADVELACGQSEVLVPVKALVNGRTIFRESLRQTQYHHLLFDTHEILLSSGCASESFHAGRVGLSGFDADLREEVFALFPELRSLPKSFGPTARRVVKAHEARLLREARRPDDSLFAIPARVA